MARPTHRLTAKGVQAAGPGYHADGGGLYLLVTAAGTASWVFRYRRRRGLADQGKAGRLREMGLGSAADFTLAEARERARAARQLLADGLDPIDHKRTEAARTLRLWGTARGDYIAAHRAGWKNGKQGDQWAQSLADYGPDELMPVQAVTTEVVRALLAPIWTTKTETATRVRSRIERIWDAEKVKGNVTGENPARWRGHLEHLLPKPGKVKTARHHAAMPWADLPAFYQRLTEREGDARDALRITILTAARTDEVLGMPDQAEVDAARKLWTIPAGRMKGGETHEVPLTAEALRILARRPQSRPFDLSNAAMLALLQNAPPKGFGLPYTVHGFRSSFFDWVRDNGHAPDHVADAALAHKVRDEVKAAYGRSKLLALRRKLMERWTAFLTGKK